MFSGTSGSLRAGLVFLTVLGVVGLVAELAYSRHWGEWWQVVPWLTSARLRL